MAHINSEKMDFRGLAVECDGLVVGGVELTGADLTSLDGLTASAAELNFNDGSVAGTSVASKTLVLDANKHVDILGLPASGLKIGVSGSETVVTASGAELNFNAGVSAGTPAQSKTLVLSAARGVAAGVRFTAAGTPFLTNQPAPSAKTTSTTLTAAEVLAGIITGNQGGAGAAAYTLPLATDFETALIALFPDLANNDAYDFSVINISTNAAETVTVTTNTGWTLVGDMILAANATGDDSYGRFRARRTAANTYSLYRIG